MRRYGLGPRAQEVYDELREQLSAGSFAPGDRLPSQRELAAQYGVAPLTLRQALDRLQEEGMLRLEQGRGTFVCAPEAGRAAAGERDDRGQISALLLSLQESEQRFRAMFDQAAVGVAQSDLEGRWLLVNQRLLDLYGYSWEELSRIRFTDITHPDDIDEDLALFARLLAGEIPSYSLEKRYIRKDGSIIWVTVTISLVRDAEGRPRYTMAIVENIDERKRGEEALRQSEARYRQMFERNQAIKLLVDPASGAIIDANPAACAFYGFTHEQFLTKNVVEINVAEPETVLGRITDVMREQRISRSVRHRLASGEERDVEIHSCKVEVDARAFLYTIVQDVTERKRAEAKLKYQALHDSLTALPNRALLQDRLEQALRAARRSGDTVALLLIDLDRFKEINDTFGHHLGDDLLRELGGRLAGSLRASDTIARLGGDEFAILLPGVGAHGAEEVAEKVLRTLERPICAGGQSLMVEGSIGVTVFPDHGDDGSTLLRRADVAMYNAKRTRSGYALYVADDDHHSVERLALMADMRRAIDGDQLVLHFQPKLSLRSKQVVGVEALLRWQHPERGLISPEVFIPLAEHTGAIKPLTEWVLRHALAQCRAWHDRGLQIHVAVNLSPRSLHDPDLVPMVERLLCETGAEPGWLQVEVTEGAVMEDPFRAAGSLTRLRELGARLSIDDFGTGYSSLAYLKRLPIHEVKIDRSFVLDMATSESDARIVRATISLTHDLGLQAVAEGVENRLAWDRLISYGCDLVQGYYLSPPLPAEGCTEWLEAWQQGSGRMAFHGGW